MSERRNQGEHRNSGGETPGRREAMDRMERDMVRNGTDPQKAREVVIGAAQRADRYDDRR